MGLFKPAWKSRNFYKREKAVAKLDDQAILSDIAKNDPALRVREVAIQKLTNTAVLRDIIQTGQVGYVVEAARNRLEIIEEPLRAQQEKQLLDAVKHTDDQEELFKMLAQARLIDTKMEILEKINDQQILVKAVAERHSIGARYQRFYETAVGKITDPEFQMKLLCDYGDICDDATVRKILDEMDDRKKILHILRNAKSYEIRHTALDKIKDEQELMQTLDELKKEMGTVRSNTNGEYPVRHLQEEIVKKINDPQLLQNIAFFGTKAARLAAIDKIDNEDVLYAIATQMKDETTRRWAIKKIKNQENLSKLLYSEQDVDKQKELADRIRDVSLLREIVHGNAGEAARKVAAKRLLLHNDVGQQEKDNLVEYILSQFGVMALFTVVPEEQYAQYGLRKDVFTHEMHDQWGPYDETTVDYYYNGERVRQSDRE